MAVPVLVLVAFACAWVGGRDAGLGSVSAGAFTFGDAITEPHFVSEIESSHDVVLPPRSVLDSGRTDVPISLSPKTDPTGVETHPRQHNSTARRWCELMGLVTCP
jgi:hypothetical protein